MTSNIDSITLRQHALRVARFSCVLATLAALTTIALPSIAVAGLSGTSDAAKTRAITPMVPASVAPAPRSARAFDGTWDVRTSQGCATAGRSSVSVNSGRIRGQGLSGTVDPDGNVRTVARAGFLSIVSTGRVQEQSGSGTYRQSDGCTGTWVARRR